ncbi:MAG: carbohydrate ABC transporter permease [Thermocrispum sp.]
MTLTTPERTLFSASALRTTRGRATYWLVFCVVLAGFVAVFVFPFYWLVTSGMKTSQELLRTPPTLLPQQWRPGNYRTAWESMDLGQYLLNTLLQVGGALVLQLVLLTAAAYALSRLRPAFGQVILGGILATLMVPAQALVVPKYLTVLDLPVLNVNLLNSPTAIWLPAVANGFSLYLLKRFFDQLPQETLDAAAVDGAGPLRILWHIVLPMSRPVLGVVSIFAVVAIWQDFLWPMLAIPDLALAPISVGLVQLSEGTEQNVLMAALVIASLPVIALFLLFQRHIIAGISAGGLKG